MDNLQSQLLKLDALLAHTCGESFEAFNGLNDEAKHWYLLHLSELTMQCAQDAGRITEQLLSSARDQGKTAREATK